MRKPKIEILFLIAFTTLLIVLPVRYSDCDSTATASPAADETCGLICHNLRQGWNYLFHPDRINQCKPRELEGEKTS